MTDFAAIKSSVAVQNAFARARELRSDNTEAAATSGTKTGTDFADFVQNAAKQTVETVRVGDQSAAAGLTGQANIQQVVEATMAMESTVKVSVALRDKLVEAYQEVMRMPI